MSDEVIYIKANYKLCNFYNSYKSSLSSTITANSGVDWISVSDYGSGTNNRIQFGARNGNNTAGDYIRVLVKPTTNNAPTAPR